MQSAGARRSRALLGLALLCACIRPAVAQPAVSHHAAVASVTDIDAFCNDLRRITNTSHQHLFAMLSPDGRPAPWREFGSDVELHTRLKTAPGAYAVAEYWKRADNAVLVKTTESSARDWSRFIRHCYRSDGSLARTEYTMSSGDEERGKRGIRIRHFGPDGSQIRMIATTQNLEAEPGARRDFAAQETLYKTVAALPFANLLKTGQLAR
jgi:hypothetical protein